MASDNYNNPELPEELLIEIFLRSSVESLLRAKCVCKQWYALIKSPGFVLDHLHYQKVHNKGRFLLQYQRDDIKQYNYALFDNETPVSGTYHDHCHLQLVPYDLCMEGPINGLYCFNSILGHFVLWNPALREFKTLPLSHQHFFPHTMPWYTVIGFGLDTSTSDHKLVVIRSFDDHYNGFSSNYVSVYNLSTNSWRLLYNFTHLPLLDRSIIENKNSLFLNGVYYWWKESCVLLGFDMVKETFREILGHDVSRSKFLETYPHSKFSDTYLTIYDDKVALLIQKEFHVEVWVMLEEGIWTEQFSINSLPRLFWFVGIWKNIGFLFATNDSDETYDVDRDAQVVLCNINFREMKNVGPRGVNVCFRASVYYESLVSVDLETNHERETSLTEIEEYNLPKSYF